MRGGDGQPERFSSQCLLDLQFSQPGCWRCCDQSRGGGEATEVRIEDGNISLANLFCRLKYQQPLFLSHEPQEEEVFFHILSITLEIENGTSTGSKPGRAGGPKADFHGQLHWSLCLSSSNARYSDPSESNSRFKLWISGRFWVQKIGPHSVDLDKLTQVWAHESRFFEAAIFRRWQSITMRRRTQIFTRLGILFFISH